MPTIDDKQNASENSQLTVTSVVRADETTTHSQQTTSDHETRHHHSHQHTDHATHARAIA
jgi:hypothetical protein